MTVTVHNIDTKLLRKQIIALLEVNDPSLEGIVHLLESILDNSEQPS
tara:strand:+ start:1383 stop:1523 length:141 start_codon:yes stop_codon:yes gene_type:complete